MATARTEMPWEDLLERARGDRLVARSRVKGAPARERPLPQELHGELRDGLRAAGIERLYTHQDETLAAAYAGHTIVTTGTASGKSLAFNLPVLDTLAHDRFAPVSSA